MTLLENAGVWARHAADRRGWLPGGASRAAAPPASENHRGVLKDLQQAVPFAPLHDPEAIRLIRDMMGRFPQARHYACFDTIFHQTMPAEASTYAIPSEYRRRGVRRYGFHGLSLRRRGGRYAGGFRPGQNTVSPAHGDCPPGKRLQRDRQLVDGRSVDNTMGLTPTGGVVMGTRPGDLDPGLVLYLLRQAKGDRDTACTSWKSMLNHQAGMVALSGLPNDMRAVRKAAAAGNADARLAIEVFCRSVRKAIGAYVWLLGGLDALVFTGGIGEHDVRSRAEILGGLGILRNHARCGCQ